MELKDISFMNKLRNLVDRERAATLEILDSLSEVEKRRTHLALGYSSLFLFCTAELGYSESAASRRIRASRLISKFPEVREKLKARKLNLSTISVLAGIVTIENKDQLLTVASGKSKRELEEIAVSYKPARKKEIVDKVVPIGFERKKPQSSKQASIFEAPSSKPCAKINNRHESAPIAQQPKEDPKPTVKEYKIEFSATEDLLKQVQEAKELLSSKHPQGASLKEVFGAALECFIQSNRRDKKVRKINSKRAGKTNGRNIPAAVRREVLKRDSYCCSFVGEDGKKCGSTWQIEVDHIVPAGVGGVGTAENTRVLCRSHNVYAAEKFFGKKVMDRYRRA